MLRYNQVEGIKMDKTFEEIKKMKTWNKKSILKFYNGSYDEIINIDGVDFICYNWNGEEYEAFVIDNKTGENIGLDGVIKEDFNRSIFKVYNNKTDSYRNCKLGEMTDNEDVVESVESYYRVV